MGTPSVGQLPGAGPGAGPLHQDVMGTPLVGQLPGAGPPDADLMLQDVMSTGWGDTRC